MYEAVFRVYGDGAYEVATDGTGTIIELWCNDHSDLLHVSGRDVDDVLAEVRETVGIGERLAKGNEQVLVTEDCLKSHLDNNVERYLASAGCLLVPPLKYAEGGKLVRALALSADSLSAVYRALAAEFDVTVESKREVQSVTPDAPLLTVDAVLPDLSPRQREVFLAAYEGGYYELPRETTTEAVAARVGVERRTAEDHLRRAEKKLAEALVEYL
ncbi:transcriptional regulator [Haloarcula sp. CBA1130]|uniref:helix-turn-helix domain-containing protein n=1 Tax=unclassified Haloarcula TaxID=2624677 RepID=UPI001248D42B|nr:MULTISPECIES: helix-turn-helix domain-containing protein [unclassified Haloarcula]KAA9396876.1 transcriptional regulator [Haloarcula sp. CBA1129]KAA9401836.1 transcriptional regulator [Haloarcula sp. CBA1130]